MSYDPSGTLRKLMKATKAECRIGVDIQPRGKVEDDLPEVHLTGAVGCARRRGGLVHGPGDTMGRLPSTPKCSPRCGLKQGSGGTCTAAQPRSRSMRSAFRRATGNGWSMLGDGKCWLGSRGLPLHSHILLTPLLDTTQGAPFRVNSFGLAPLVE